MIYLKKNCTNECPISVLYCKLLLNGSQPFKWLKTIPEKPTIPGWAKFRKEYSNSLKEQIYISKILVRLEHLKVVTNKFNIKKTSTVFTEFTLVTL